MSKPGAVLSCPIKSKRASIIILLMALCFSGSNGTDNAFRLDPLDEAKMLLQQGKYEDALQKHIWIHNHVLESRPAYRGVRLSYALDDWIELGQKHPKALAALKEIRNEKTARLLKDEQDKNLFLDVEAINSHLNESKATVELFKKIGEAHPAFAEAVYFRAEEALVKAGEYALAKKHLGDPKVQLARAKRNFDQGMEYAKTSPTGAVSKKAHENIFTDRVVRIITVLDKTGDRKLAQSIQTAALAVLDTPAIRNTLKN